MNRMDGNFCLVLTLLEDGIRDEFIFTFALSESLPKKTKPLQGGFCFLKNKKICIKLSTRYAICSKGKLSFTKITVHGARMATLIGTVLIKFCSANPRVAAPMMMRLTLFPSA